MRTTDRLRLDGDGQVPLRVLVDGSPHNDWRMDGDTLEIELPGSEHRIETEVEIHPDRNTQLMGLYASGGNLCTQCEAEGFRRITFFPDRPDVLARYAVRMTADRTRFPVLLANGDPIAQGDLPDGRHWAEWRDPFPKPCYLFAMVAGELSANRATFTTMSGRRSSSASGSAPAISPRPSHALHALKLAMAWDERVYGREYDLDVFNIVAVDDFNFGAMENKGLNIFNSRYILADPDTATDADYDAIAAVVAHEYFHNWSGNRVTCRDWFQLSLKEGFTVFRDQGFSADQGSRPRSSGSRTCAACAPPSSPRMPARSRTRSGPILHGDQQLLHRDDLQQGRRGDPDDGDHPGPRALPRWRPISISTAMTGRPRRARISSAAWSMAAGSTCRSSAAGMPGRDTARIGCARSRRRIGPRDAAACPAHPADPGPARQGAVRAAACGSSCSAARAARP